MTAHEVQVWCGEGFTDPADFERANTLVWNAVEIANEGLDRIGLDTLRGMNCTVHLTDPNDKFFGNASGAHTMFIHIVESKFRNRQISGPSLSDYVFHEGVHCLRKGVRGSGISLPEVSASEGLAYVAERQYRQWRVNAHGGAVTRGISLVDKVRGLPRRQMEEIRRDFICDVFGNDREAAWKRWHDATPQRLRVGLDVVVGIDSVLRHQRAGYKIADLIDLSPAEVLGIA